MSSRTIAVLNSKGGVGKTTVSMLLSAIIARTGRRVVVIDSDRQGSATLWAARGFDGQVEPIDAGQDAVAIIKRLQEQYEFVVIDCPPNAESDVTKAALSCSDLLLIPCRPAPLDMQATAIVMAVCNQHYPNLPVRVVLNCVPAPMTALARDMAIAIDEQWPTCRVRLGLRTAFAEASALGSLTAVGGVGARKALDEIQQLAVEVLTSF